MTARAPVGASNRGDLFGRREEQKFREGDSLSLQPELQQPSDDPLQLEHILGYAGDFKKTVLFIPFQENIFIKSMGALLAVENIIDPHSQRICRGHDSQISALATSLSGRFVASGQVGTKNFKGFAAPVFVWDTTSFTCSIVLRGLSNRVNLIAFSTDEAFVCACGEDSLLYVWDINTGEVILGHRLSGPASVLQFCGHQQEGRRIRYELIVGVGTALHLCLLSFDPARVQWSIKMTPFGHPPGLGGLTRYFHCMELSADGVSVLVGSTAGELLVYRKDTAVFRACIPISANGLQSMVPLPDGDVVCGGGDGKVRKLTGSGLEWAAVEEVQLDSPVVSLSLAANQLELLAACSSGNIYRIAVQGLSEMLCSSGHTSAVTAIAFGDAVGFFATGTASGELRVWDVGDYACQALTRVPKAGAVHAIHILSKRGGGDELISGWEDGFVRCHDMGRLSRQLWTITNAHRGGVLSVASYQGSALEYLVTGGADNAVRVWRLSTRELFAQLAEQTKPVPRVIIDCRQPNLVHSISYDGSIMTFDIRTQRRTVVHFIPKGNHLSALTQRSDGEQELITCESNGRIQFWDCDVRDAVMTIQDPGRDHIRCCAISPSSQFLAYAGDDYAVKILNIQTSEVISMGVGHSGTVRTLAWTPDEKQLISGGDDFCICVWNFFLGGLA